MAAISEKEISREEMRMIKIIHEAENDFLLNPSEQKAHDLIREWEELRCFRYLNNVSTGTDRSAPLRLFLDAHKLYFRFRREKKKRKALSLLERLRHDD